MELDAAHVEFHPLADSEAGSGAEAEDQGLEPATEALVLCYLFAGCSNSVTEDYNTVVETSVIKTSAELRVGIEETSR